MQFFTRAVVVLCIALSTTGVDSLSARRHPGIHNKSDNVKLPHLSSKRKLSHFIVVPEHKLLFCYINKVGCTSFNDMFRRLRSRYDPGQAKGSVWNRNTPEKHNVSEDALRQMLVDPTWHKAVFFREPVERFVSAYKSKCEGADKRFGSGHCRRMFGKDFVPFDDAVAMMTRFDNLSEDKNADLEKADPHFWLQRDFCGGLEETLQFYDTVEQLDRRTSNQKVRDLLSKVGVKAEAIPHFDEIFPPEGNMDWQEFKHNTDSGADLQNYLPSEKPQLASALIKHYQDDYRLFNIAIPSWINSA